MYFVPHEGSDKKASVSLRHYMAPNLSVNTGHSMKPLDWWLAPFNIL